MGTQIQHSVRKNYWLAILSIILFIIGIYMAFIGIGIVFIALAIYLSKKSNVLQIELGQSIIPGILLIIFGTFIIWLGQNFSPDKSGVAISKLLGIMVAISGFILSVSIYLKKRNNT